MADEQHTTTVEVSTSGLPATLSDQSRYLVIFDQHTSTKIVLPAEGSMVIGRGHDVEIRLLDSSVSRRHARIVIEKGQARVEDLGSHNGVILNGERIDKVAPIGSRDIVTLGRVTLIYHSGSRSATARRVHTYDGITRRAADEIARARTLGKPLTVIVLGLDGVPASPASLAEQAAENHEVAWASPTELVALAVGVTAADAPRIGEALVDAVADHVPARAAHATFPDDGADLQGLLARARVALAAWETPRVTGGTVHRIALGDRTVIIADPAMVRLYELLRRLAASDLPVLVGGETGAGKEIAAWAIHSWSRRAGKPFVALNCASLPETLAESELFGHDKGAFSGAATAKQGLLESSAGGTVFLDEFGELSLPVQAKLLRVVETKRLMRLGELKEREVDIRVVAATNRDLEAEVKAGRFRQDLFFRLNTATVWIPPLRERPRELLLLAAQFLEEACKRAGRDSMTLSPAAQQVLSAYSWPGNVRELRNTIDFVVAAAEPDEDTVEAESLPARILVREGGEPTVPGAQVAAALKPKSVTEEIRDLEKQRMIEALARCEGNQSRAAELIGMPRRTFVAKLKLYNIKRD
jgi:two-component system, NtrC family, response regulator AtoC